MRRRAEAETEETPEEDLTGVEIEITPAGKSMKRLTLLSGGEKSMTALAFLFAVFLARPCPFYILDEVEAALDDLNITRFLDLVRRYADRAQFIVVTHQRRTMEAADVLYGVSMGDDGVSKVVSRRLAARGCGVRAPERYPAGARVRRSGNRSIRARCGARAARLPAVASGAGPPGPPSAADVARAWVRDWSRGRREPRLLARRTSRCSCSSRSRRARRPARAPSPPR